MGSVSSATPNATLELFRAVRLRDVQAPADSPAAEGAAATPEPIPLRPAPHAVENPALATPDRPAPGTAQPAATSADVPQEAQTILRRSGLAIARQNDGWALMQGTERVTLLGRSDERLTAASLPDGRLAITGLLGNAPIATTTIDPRAATFTVEIGASYRTESRIPATNLQIFDLGQQAARRDPALRDSGDVPVNGSRVPSLRNLFASAPPGALNDLRYVATNRDLGSNGMTLDGRAFVDSQRMARENEPGAFAGADTGSRDSTVHNELAHVIWSRMTDEAYRARGGTPQDAGYTAFREAAARGNWFADQPGLPNGVTIGSNLQANELVSDAASIGTDARDFYRVLAWATPTATPSEGYRATVALARGLARERLEARGRPGSELDAALAGPSEALPQALRFNAADMSWFQARYQSIGRSIVERYGAELSRRTPGD